MVSRDPYSGSSILTAAVPGLQSDDFLKPAPVTFLTGKLRSEKGVHQLAGHFDSDHPRAEYEHIHIIVLHSLVGGVGVVTEPSPDAG